MAELVRNLPPDERDSVRRMLKALAYMPEEMRRGVQMQFNLWGEVYKPGRNEHRRERVSGGG